jgi:hypothetical protein
MRNSLRYLRITWTVFFGIACVLLIALWVHTLHYQVRVEGWISTSHFVRFTTFKHWNEVEATSYEIKAGNWYPKKTFQNNRVAPSQEKGASPLRRWQFSHSTGPGESHTSITFPVWLSELLLALLAIAPWLRHRPTRFSLRTLLIATTLVAVVLGLIVWLR